MEHLNMYTIFNNPLDHPNKVVVRKFKVKVGTVEATNDIVVCDSIEEARARVPEGLSPLMRDPSDHPSVVETWI